MDGLSFRLGASWYSSPNRMQNTSARMDAAVVSLGQTITVNAMVAILFSTPTSVNVVAVMTLQVLHPLYEIPTPMTHDAMSQNHAPSPISTSLTLPNSPVTKKRRIVGGIAKALV